MAPQDLIADHKTKADFYAFMAQEPEGRFEFEDGRIIDMTGGTGNHSLIGSRFVYLMTSQLNQREWAVHGPDRGIETPTTVRYPDAMVERLPIDGASRWMQKPVLVVEVLSPSSERNDLGRKVAEYTAFETLEAYIVAEQGAPRCTIWVRDAMRSFPAEGLEIEGAQGAIAVPALGVSIALAEVYLHLL
jgi:Uma2 family endonuclease